MIAALRYLGGSGTRAQVQQAAECGREHASTTLNALCRKGRVHRSVLDDGSAFYSLVAPPVQPPQHTTWGEQLSLGHAVPGRWAAACRCPWLAPENSQGGRTIAYGCPRCLRVVPGERREMWRPAIRVVVMSSEGRAS